MDKLPHGHETPEDRHKNFLKATIVANEVDDPFISPILIVVIAL